MLYTVSAVQILATLDAFEDLENHIENGKLRVAQCERPNDQDPRRFQNADHTMQILLHSRIDTPERLQETSGARQTLASYLVH